MSGLRDEIVVAVLAQGGEFSEGDIVTAVRARRPDLSADAVAAQLRAVAEVAGQVEQPPAVAREVSPGRYVVAGSAEVDQQPTHPLDLSGWSPGRKALVAVLAVVAALGTMAGILVAGGGS